MFTDWVLNAIGNALNHYVRADEESARKLDKLKGKCIAITLLPKKTPFYLNFHADGVSLSAICDTPPAASILGTPLRLFALGLNPKERNQFFADDVQLLGDAEFAQAVVQLFDQVEWDFEEQASHWLGDIAAHKLGNLVKQTNSHWQTLCSNMHEQVSEYLQEEASFLPDHLQFTGFLQEVDEVRMATDRLEAKINHYIASKKDAE